MDSQQVSSIDEMKKISRPVKTVKTKVNRTTGEVKVNPAKPQKKEGGDVPNEKKETLPKLTNKRKKILLLYLNDYLENGAQCDSCLKLRATFDIKNEELQHFLNLLMTRCRTVSNRCDEDLQRYQDLYNKF